MTPENNNNTYDHHHGAAPLLRPVSPWRTVPFLVVNLVGFVAVNAFWRYLSTGHWVDVSPAAYQHDLATPLGQALQDPLNVFTRQWMVFVTASLLAGIVFIPIIVSVLYRLSLAAVFVIVVAVVGHCPVLAAALAVGCILAARTRLRSDMPFLAAVLGLMPIGLYLYFFAFAGLNVAATMPIRRLVMYVPFIGAMVLAVVGSGIVLALARVTGFRPGVVWPVLLALLVAPVVVFYWKVGADELDYALIANTLAPGDAVFREESIETWKARTGTVGLKEQAIVNEVDGDLRAKRTRLLKECEAFLAAHPDSPRAPAVLWIAGQCHSVQFSLQALRTSLIKYSAAYPLPSSAQTWQHLAEEYPDSPQAALANRRLAELALQGGQARRALSLLEAVRRDLADTIGRSEPATPETPWQSVPTREYCREAMFQVERLAWLIAENGALADTPEGKAAAEALSAFLSVNPYKLNAEQQLRRLNVLGKRFKQTRLADNIELAIACAQPSVYDRAKRLIKLANVTPETDTTIEACFLLGRLTLRTEDTAVGLTEGIKKPEWYLEQVKIARANPWQKRAGQALEELRRGRPRESDK